MRILFISGELIGSALVHQLINEGADLKLYIDHPDRKDCFAGIATKTDDWRQELPWVGTDGLIVFDDVIFGGAQEELRAQGYSVIGGDSLSDKLEEDREYFQTILSEHGIATLPSYNFETADEAIAFVTAERGEWVVKQSSHLGMLNYVGQRADAQDVLSILAIYKAKGITPVHLQKRARGVEIGVARYFNGTDWVGPIEINLEHKPLFNGDIGPLTAEMGTVMWYSTDEQIRLYTETLAKLKPYLQKIQYKGDIDINCIVNESGIWPLEATMRFGTPSTEMQCHLHDSHWSHFLKALADGESYDLEYKTGYGVVVSIGVPPFPFAPEVFTDDAIQTNQGTHIFFTEDITDTDMSHIHFEEVSKTVDHEGNDSYYLAGKHGYAMYVTGHGATVADARAEVYGIIQKIIIPKMFYRTDIGEKFIAEDYQKLVDWNII